MTSLTHYYRTSTSNPLPNCTLPLPPTNSIKSIIFAWFVWDVYITGLKLPELTHTGQEVGTYIKIQQSRILKMKGDTSTDLTLTNVRGFRRGEHYFLAIVIEEGF